MFKWLKSLFVAKEAKFTRMKVLDKRYILAGHDLINGKEYIVHESNYDYPYVTDEAGNRLYISPKHAGKGFIIY